MLPENIKKTSFFLICSDIKETNHWYKIDLILRSDKSGLSPNDYDYSMLIREEQKNWQNDNKTLNEADVISKLKGVSIVKDKIDENVTYNERSVDGEFAA